MTRRGSLAGAYVLSARFLEWARNNGRAELIAEIEEARAEYRRSGANTSRYKGLTDEELEAAHRAAGIRLDRLETEGGRRRRMA